MKNRKSYKNKKETILNFNIKNFKFGLREFKEKENYKPTLKEVLRYKENIEQLFQEYQVKLRNIINSDNHDLTIKYDIILFYLKQCYENNIEEFVDENFNINEKEIIDLEGVNYLRNEKYPKILKINSWS